MQASSSLNWQKFSLVLPCAATWLCGHSYLRRSLLHAALLLYLDERYRRDMPRWEAGSESII